MKRTAAWAILALAATLHAQPGAPVGADESPEPNAPNAASQNEAGQNEAERDPEPDESATAPLERFVPSESVPAGTAIAMPTDI